MKKENTVNKAIQDLEIIEGVEYELDELDGNEAILIGYGDMPFDNAAGFHATGRYILDFATYEQSGNVLTSIATEYEDSPTWEEA